MPRTQEAADAVGSLEDDDVVTGTGQLLCGGQTGGPGSDDGDSLAGQLFGRQRHDPALIEGVVDDLDLDLLDGHRVLVDAEHARALTRRRAQPTSELREVVGGVQPLDRITPTIRAYQVVPLGNEVAQRTAVVAERDTAVHAPSRLIAQHVVGEVLVDLFPVEQAQRDRPPLRGLAPCVLEEAFGIRHSPPP